MLRRTTLALAAALTTALVALVLPAAPASAAPRPVDDRATLIAGGRYTLDPLANDTTTPFSIGALSLCGLTGYDTRRLYVEIVDDRLVVEVVRGFAGQTAIVYDACQDGDRQSAVMTVEVLRVTDATAVRKKNAEGKVVFTNPNPVGVTISYGSISSGRPDVSRIVPPRSRVVVRTRRSAIFWVATVVYQGAVITAGDGDVRRLQKKK